VHGIILERGRGLGYFFYEMQNGAIWPHFRSFSVLRRLKTYVRSTMKNDRLSSLGLMHINQDFEVDLYKAMEVFEMVF
jgi:translation elongation factor EF-G